MCQFHDYVYGLMAMVCLTAVYFFSDLLYCTFSIVAFDNCTRYSYDVNIIDDALLINC